MLQLENYRKCISLGMHNCEVEKKKKENVLLLQLQLQVYLGYFSSIVHILCLKSLFTHRSSWIDNRAAVDVHFSSWKVILSIMLPQQCFTVEMCLRCPWEREYTTPLLNVFLSQIDFQTFYFAQSILSSTSRAVLVLHFGVTWRELWFQLARAPSFIWWQTANNTSRFHFGGSEWRELNPHQIFLHSRAILLECL